MEAESLTTSNKLPAQVHPTGTQTKLIQFINTQRANYQSYFSKKPSSSTAYHFADNDNVASLQAQLEKEINARREVEDKFNSVQEELEDLSQSLFEEANKMVSKEREARAYAEDRVALMEQRQNEKSQRLQELELAIDRITRVRGILSSRNSLK